MNVLAHVESNHPIPRCGTNFQLGKTCETMSISCTPMWLSDGCEDGGDFLEIATSDDLVKERYLIHQNIKPQTAQTINQW